MAQATVDEMAEQVSRLMAERLKIRGEFSAQVPRSRWIVPRRVYRAGLALGEALEMSRHPKLRSRIDLGAAQKSCDCMTWHLKRVGRKERYGNMVMDAAARVALIFLVTGALWLTALYYGMAA